MSKFIAVVFSTFYNDEISLRHCILLQFLPGISEVLDPRAVMDIGDVILQCDVRDYLLTSRPSSVEER